MATVSCMCSKCWRRMTWYQVSSESMYIHVWVSAVVCVCKKVKVQGYHCSYYWDAATTNFPNSHLWPYN